MHRGLDLSHAHLELTGLMVIAWNTLRKAVVQMERPQVIYVYKLSYNQHHQYLSQRMA